MVIGLTGRYCAGKNAAAGILEELGCPSIDVDKLGHSALENNAGKIREAFGSEVINGEGGVDRRKLGSIVFSDPKMLRKLELISHPWMVVETGRLAGEMLESGAGRVVINAAILEKMGLHKLCDAVIWIDAPFFRRLRRGMSRDGHGLRQVLKRIWSQRKLSPQSLRKTVDTYIVGNSAGMNELRQGIIAALDEIDKKGRYGR